MSEKQAPWGSFQDAVDSPDLQAYFREKSASYVRDILRTFAQHPIAFYPAFARCSGSAASGLFLSQLFFWTPLADDPDGWVYKTQDDWEQETTLTRREQESARKHLKAAGLIEERLSGLPAKLYYRILVDALADALKLDATNQPYKDGGKRHTSMAESANLLHTENTTENTTETTKGASGKPANGKSHKPVDDDFIREMVEEFGPSLGTSLVRPEIDAAMNHKALLKAIDQRQYVRNWLRKAVGFRSSREGAPSGGGTNGTAAASATRGQAPAARKPTGLEKWS